jgi:hypothetical protein
VTSVPRERTTRPADAVAGFLAAAALFLGAFQLFYRPFRLAPVALILLLISTLMSQEHGRLRTLALTAIGICFVVGAALQVITDHPLY